MRDTTRRESGLRTEGTFVPRRLLLPTLARSRVALPLPSDPKVCQELAFHFKCVWAYLANGNKLATSCLTLGFPPSLRFPSSALVHLLAHLGHERLLALRRLQERPEYARDVREALRNLVGGHNDDFRSLRADRGWNQVLRYHANCTVGDESVS